MTYPPPPPPLNRGRNRLNQSALGAPILALTLGACADQYGNMRLSLTDSKSTKAKTDTLIEGVDDFWVYIGGGVALAALSGGGGGGGGTTPPAPVNDGAAAFAVSGNANKELIAVVQSADPDGNGTFSYKWEKTADTVSGTETLADLTGWSEASTSDSYLPQSGDSYVRLAEVTYTDGEGNDETVTSETATFKVERVASGTQNGTAGADYLAATGSIAVTLNGLGGDDILHGGLAGDILSGGAGDDFLYGLGGDNTLEGGAGSDVMNGGGGIGDTLSYASDTVGVHIDFSLAFTDYKGQSGLRQSTTLNDPTSHAYGDHTINFEIVQGGSGNDQFIGGSYGTQFDGGVGNDTFTYAIGVLGFFGNDKFIGGDGSDTADFSRATSAVVANLGGTQDGDGFITATLDGSNSTKLKNVENLIGGSAGDTLTGDSGANMLDGGAGVDVLTGSTGNDIFVLELASGSRGADVVTDFASGDKVQIDAPDSTAFSGLQAADFAQLGSGETLHWVTNSTTNTRTSGQGNGSEADTVFFIDADNDNTLDSTETVVLILEDYSTALVAGDFDII